MSRHEHIVIGLPIPVTEVLVPLCDLIEARWPGAVIANRKRDKGVMRIRITLPDEEGE